MQKSLPRKDPNSRSWMVVYTRSNWERKIARTLQFQQIEAYCPLIKAKRHITDHCEVDIPLFSSYLFVHVNLREQIQVLQTSGVTNFIQYDGKPVTIQENELDRVKTLVKQYHDITLISARNLHIGDRIMVKEGPFAASSGEVMALYGKTVLVVLRQLDFALVATVKVKSSQLILA